MAKNGIVTAYDDASYPAVAAFTAAVAAGTSANTVVKGSPGRLFKVVVTAQAGVTTGSTTIYDNASAASGTPLITLPNNAAIGTVYTLDLPAASGVVIGGGANAPGMTLGYS